jgi:hypothetical protein
LCSSGIVVDPDDGDGCAIFTARNVFLEFAENVLAGALTGIAPDAAT